MSKDMGFFVYLGYISGMSGKYQGYMHGGRYMHGQIQRSICSASSRPFPKKIKQKTAARLSFTLAGGYHSHRLLSGALSRR